MTVSVLDKNNNLVPNAGHLIKFKVEGSGILKALDDGSQTNLEPFTGNEHHVFNGLGLAVIQSKVKPGTITLSATADGLQAARVTIESN